jgi:hypothetical protein
MTKDMALRQIPASCDSSCRSRKDRRRESLQKAPDDPADPEEDGALDAPRTDPWMGDARATADQHKLSSKHCFDEALDSIADSLDLTDCVENSSNMIWTLSSRLSKRRPIWACEDSDRRSGIPSQTTKTHFPPETNAEDDSGSTGLSKEARACLPDHPPFNDRERTIGEPVNGDTSPFRA